MIAAPAPKGVLETIKAAASTIVKKVARLIRPEKRTNKDVVINADTTELAHKSSYMIEVSRR